MNAMSTPERAKNPAAEWTVLSILGAAEKYLAEKGVQSPRLDAEILLAHALDMARIDLYVKFERPVSEAERALYRGFISRRGSAREPAAYITGRRDFMSLAFAVTPAVLIPRPETEFVVEEILVLARAGFKGAPAVADVGTGSGCIALSVAHYLLDAKVYATEISPDALTAARGNAASQPRRGGRM